MTPAGACIEASFKRGKGEVGMDEYQVQHQLMRNESARLYHHRTRKCMPPQKLRREIR